MAIQVGDDRVPRADVSEHLPLVTQGTSTMPASPPQPAVADAGCAEVFGNPTNKQASSSRTLTSSSRRKLLKEAVLQRSGRLPHPKQVATPPPSSDVADQPHLHHTVNWTACAGSYLPPPCFGDMKFSHLRQLHIWLKGFCRNRDIPFVDNFASFLNQPEFYKPDRLHQNHVGSQILSLNTELTPHSCKAFTA